MGHVIADEPKDDFASVPSYLNNLSNVWRTPLCMRIPERTTVWKLECYIFNIFFQQSVKSSDSVITATRTVMSLLQFANACLSNNPQVKSIYHWCLDPFVFINRKYQWANCNKTDRKVGWVPCWQKLSFGSFIAGRPHIWLFINSGRLLGNCKCLFSFVAQSDLNPSQQWASETGLRRCSGYDEGSAPIFLKQYIFCSNALVSRTQLNKAGIETMFKWNKVIHESNSPHFEPNRRAIYCCRFLSYLLAKFSFKLICGGNFVRLTPLPRLHNYLLPCTGSFILLLPICIVLSF